MGTRLRMHALCVGLGLSVMVGGHVPLPAQGMLYATGPESRTTAQVSAKPTVTVNLQNVLLAEAIRTVGERAHVTLLYTSDMLPARRVSYRATNVPVLDVLAHLLRDANIRIEATKGGAIALIPGDTRTARVAQGTITGKVVHARTKQPVAGATILLGNSTRSVVTAADGAFRVVVPAGEQTIQVRGIGFVKYTQRVTVTADQAVAVDIVLEPSTSVLDEVIVTGTVVATERKSIPNPITVITAEEIERRGIRRIEEFFRGEVPGLFVSDPGTRRYLDRTETYGTGQATSEIYSRGSAGLDGGPNPIKTFVDGVELHDPSYLGTIDPHSIERIEIITGPQAATIYGSGALGGVMQIFTKHGRGGRSADVTLNLRFGILENNFSDGRTPAHQQTFTVSNAMGPQLSYSGNLSHNYSGQWRPMLFHRQLGLSLGITHTRGAFTASGSYSSQLSTNGTYQTIQYSDYGFGQRILSGEWWCMDVNCSGAVLGQRVARASSQILSLRIDHRISSQLQQQFTIGKSATASKLKPMAPNFFRGPRFVGDDTLYRVAESRDDRISGSYNASWSSPITSFLSVLGTAGFTASTPGSIRVSGCATTESSSAIIGCSGTSVPSVNKSDEASAWGGFGTWQLGFWNQAFLTLGIRGERSNTYGSEHPIDWTPRAGIAYTLEIQDVSLKLLGSYGRATRIPGATLKEEVWSYSDGWIPDKWVSRISSPTLRPERSVGPQGGVEIYYGNRGSLTINHYIQTVSDLIQDVQIDSLLIKYGSSTVQMWTPITQMRNTARIRQKGWEATGLVQLGMFSMRGTYSWNDVYVLSVNPHASANLRRGDKLGSVASHFASHTIGYSHGSVSASVVTSIVGAATGRSVWRNAGAFYTRIPVYLDNFKARGLGALIERRSGYTKSDMVLSYRLGRRVSMTLNILNAGNSYTSEQAMDPSLGRQTTLGISLRTASMP